MRTKLSIIIVNYHVKDRLFACISSILSSKTKSDYEIVVVDNDERKTIQSELKMKFPKVKYLANKNKGFGEGNNVGVGYANGEYVFFLNPDTIIKPGSIDYLIRFLSKNKQVGIVAPLLLDKNEKVYELQGTEILTPYKALFAYSFLNKLFPKNPVSNKFWKANWNKTRLKQVDVVPGTAFMMRSKLFKQVGGFDENFFLYFEEYDLCLRVSKLGYKIYINPQAKTIHFWGESTDKSKENIREIFEKSRFYYFKKHFGLLSAILTSSFLSINKSNLPIITAVLIGFFLRFYKLSDLMVMISDQGWFYLSARDIILNHTIPLVGITSSHTWLHQGPLWTYMLAGVLWISNFNPLSGGYLSICIDLVTVVTIYYVSKTLFSKKVAVLSALLYATSPLVILYARMPYHTTPIPLLSILFLFVLYMWIKGNKWYFPFVLLLCSVLYNFELSNALFGIITISFLIAGIVKKVEWAKIFSPKLIGLSIFLAGLPMIPIFLYDTTHGFSQTIKFSAWIVFQALSKVGINFRAVGPLEPWGAVISFFFREYSLLVFSSSMYISTFIFGISILLNIFIAIKLYKKKMLKENYVVFYLCSIILLLGFFTQRARSGAYLPMLFPYLIIGIVIGLVYFIKLKKLAYFLVIALSVFNVYNILSNNYWAAGSVLKPLILESKFIVKDAQGKEFSLRKKNFKSNIDINQYKYLVLWLGGKLEPSSTTIYGISNNVEGLVKKPIFMDSYISISRN